MAKKAAAVARIPKSVRNLDGVIKTLSTATKAKTVIYVHGIGNKPIESVLKCQWDRALFDFDLGERSRLAYWVNRNYYPDPVAATCGTGDFTELEDKPTGRSLSIRRQLATTSLQDEAAAITGDKERQRTLVELAEQIEGSARERLQRRALAIEPSGVESQFILFEWVTRAITRAFMRDVHDFLFVPKRRQYMEERVAERLTAGAGPFVVIGHSQGSMIAYSVLSQMAKADADVPLFITIGSPLGLPMVKSQLKDFSGSNSLRVPGCVNQWLNVADPTDPVAFDETLADDFLPKRRIADRKVTNPDSPKHPHSATGYLRTEPVRAAVHAAIDRPLFQRVAPFVIARNLTHALENARPGKREPVLIQLVDASTDARKLGAPLRPLSTVRDEVVQQITKLSGLKKEDPKLRLERLQRFVSADLTRSETERLAGLAGFQPGQLLIQRIWRNERKRALLVDSIETIHAGAARNSYNALGRNVLWAVLDSGIAAAHRHFRGVIEDQYDCTARGPLGKPGVATDQNGHGTHVAGIIAGRHEIVGPENRKKKTPVTGVAPDARLRVYKVLDRNGFGDDAWIIKALDHIAQTNEEAGALKIHGINLSLGGSFDQSSFACGHTPLCTELRRLWRQGVLVVVAAGNEGFAKLLTEEGEVDANLDLSIADPANLEECIAVGSTHRLQPHTYGVSYFSSRGPTADGRHKPDVVAPGERILSCRHDFTRGRTESDQDVRLSGTSMAAPHVSGLLAAFLSVRQEFVGQPDRVKEILLANCVDLGRDRSQQGAGLPNLMKMLMHT